MIDTVKNLLYQWAMQEIDTFDLHQSILNILLKENFKDNKQKMDLIITLQTIKLALSGKILLNHIKSSSGYEDLKNLIKEMDESWIT